jgi:hypothetical protein
MHAHALAPAVAERLSRIAAELDALMAQRSPGRASYTALGRARSAVGYAILDVRNEDAGRPARAR